jgi:hypothetical protein
LEGIGGSDRGWRLKCAQKKKSGYRTNKETRKAKGGPKIATNV